MRLREGDCASLVRRSGDHDTLVRTDTLHLLAEDLNQLALDRIPVKLSLHEHEKGHSRKLIADGRIEIIRAVSARDLLVHIDNQITYLRASRFK